MLGFTNDTQQELAFLYDPRRCSIRHVPVSTSDFPRFDGTYAIDLDVDAVTDPIRFSKPPFEAELVCHNGRRITLIGAHLKSKPPHGARSKDETIMFCISPRMMSPLAEVVRMNLTSTLVNLYRVNPFH